MLKQVWDPIRDWHTVEIEDEQVKCDKKDLKLEDGKFYYIRDKSDAVMVRICYIFDDYGRLLFISPDTWEIYFEDGKSFSLDEAYDLVEEVG